MKYFILLLVAFVFVSSCKKEEAITYTDNDVPYYDEIPDILIRNYVNRMFIDLIGREPKDAEMDAEVALLKGSNLSQISRENLVTKLQTDTTYISGDSSYFHAYYNQFYGAAKARMLEGAADAVFNQEINRLTSDIVSDSLAGNWISYEIRKTKRQRLYNVLNIPLDYRSGKIDVNEVFARCLYNSIYDVINMNSFNFINAAFDDLFFRYPTASEFDESYKMVEYNSTGVVFAEYGQNKGDLVRITTTTLEFYEGTIVWVYRSYLSRSPSTEETFFHLQDFVETKDLQQLQKQILVTDEYANF